MRRLAKWSIGIGSFIGCLIALLALLLCTGVIRVYGLTTGYNQLPKELQARVVFSQGSLTDLDKALAQVRQQRSVLLVNGRELRGAIARKGGKWLVYTFQEGCSSPSCPTLSSVTHYAEQLGARPLFVAMDLRSELFLHPEPILSIDFRYYNTTWCATFQDKFLADLTQSKDDEHYNILLFEDGQLVKKICLQRPS